MRDVGLRYIFAYYERERRARDFLSQVCPATAIDAAIAITGKVSNRFIHSAALLPHARSGAC
jgi:hypothetical protein